MEQPGLAHLLAAMEVIDLMIRAQVVRFRAHHRRDDAFRGLYISEEDVDWFATALEAVVAEAQKLGKAMTRFALRAARAGGRKPAVSKSA